MKIHYSKKFLKQLAQIPIEERLKIEQFVFKELLEIVTLSESGKIEKMVGYDEFYKVRLGRYRIGLQRQGEMLILKVVMHRKDIYKFFP